MANEDLSKLKIEKTTFSIKPRKRKKIVLATVVIIGVVVLLVLFSQGVLSPAVEVEAVSVSMTYPSQTFTMLNSSGYVVAQRKAAVASKVTGRIVSLSV
ncbi:MAG: hypothetical protein L6290_06895 [Thermodesulfovibrionales bacterium]|nr:hypothetical protein [Thermodesulfovibrionales bacterium]